MPKHPFCSGWGKGSGKQVCLNTYNGFNRLEVAWLSLNECRFYFGELNINNILSPLTDDGKTYDNLIIGLAPNGNLALWANNGYSSRLIYYTKCKEVEISISEFLEYDYHHSLEHYCEQTLIESDHAKGDLSKLFEFGKKMKKFCYRFCISCIGSENEDEIIPIVSTQTSYADGSYNRKNDLDSMNFRETSIPERLNINWGIHKKEYMLFLYFIDYNIYNVFEKFYGAHPDTKTDFIIRIDAENKKYELALFRQGLKEPVAIPESAYQLIVFKNKFEDFRSENYDQPRGAWIW